MWVVLVQWLATALIWTSRRILDFSEVVQHGIDQLEGLINLLAHFRASQDDFSANENQEYDLGLHHSIDQTREELRFVGREVVMARGETFETNWKLDVTRAHNILDLEVCHTVSDALEASTGVATYP